MRGLITKGVRHAYAVDRVKDGLASERPRVLIVVTLAEVGGVVSVLSALLPALARRFDVALAAYGSGPLPDVARATGAQYVPLRHLRRPLNPWRDPLALIELIRLCRRVRPQIVHTHSSKAGFLARLAALFAGVPIRLYTAHGWAFATHPGRTSWMYLWADRLARPLTTVTVCVSESERARGIAGRACDPARTVVIHNGIDPDAFPQRRHDGRRPVHILSVCRLKTPKDPLTLVRALALLEPGSFRAQLIGDGPDRRAIECEVRRLGLEGAVELVGERRDIAQLLAEADVFALSTTSEALPMTVLEAMAAGVPVVASGVGGVLELVRDGGTGLLVPPGDPARLARALGRLIRDLPLRRDLGAAGRARAEAQFALASFQQAHLELYEQELAARGLLAPAGSPIEQTAY